MECQQRHLGSTVEITFLASWTPIGKDYSLNFKSFIKSITEGRKVLDRNPLYCCWGYNTNCDFLLFLLFILLTIFISLRLNGYFL